MDFNELGLSEEQVQAVTGWHESQLAESKKEWDGKANENAERIIQGAADKVQEVTGIQREQGQKIADYLAQAGEGYVKTVKEQLEAQRLELDKKLKESKVDPLLKEQLEETKQQLDALKQKEAMFADWEQNDYKGKWEQAQTKLSEYKLGLAFNSIKPSFPDTVNKYEADYKWSQFVNSVNEKYDIQEVDGKWIAKDKENEYKTTELEKLFEANKDLVELAKGRQVKGLGSGSDKQNVKIDGVPFAVPENASSQERTIAIDKYLSEQGIGKLNSKYASLFAEYNKKLLEKNPAK